jgi:hypothetical protein
VTSEPFDSVPIWALYCLTVVAMLATMEAGYRLSRAMRRKSPDKTDAGLGAMAGGSLALLAFLLAFVVGFGANINNERRHLVRAEANAIGTTYLRAGFLDEANRTESRDLLREYTDLRLAALDPAQLTAAFARSEQIHNELWTSAEALAAESPTAVTNFSLYTNSLNEVINRHAELVSLVLEIRIPATVMLGLHVVALFATFLVGLQSGTGDKRNFLAPIILVLLLSVVFLLIVDLDRAQQGLLRVSQQPMIDLQRRLNSSP